MNAAALVLAEPDRQGRDGSAHDEESLASEKYALRHVFHSTRPYWDCFQPVYRLNGQWKVR
jgi:hypothetical protein